ncbi:MAG: thiamine pyrophosphate-binding protein [Lachnospiraceae bacterium]|jgi:acetolactate synthase-1/2/3 large subunit|nr:thiamine pyrophosphate-binding protein [Lachnospiraceae bacterium]
MKISEYLVQKLIEYEVTDVFGIPGGVVLDFIYALDKSEKINVHLNFHEQAAAYAACGYAQSSGKLGVAYATKGPGVTNMFTAIAEAYYDSLPVLFVTAHAQNKLNSNLRIEEEQEIDHSKLTASITKYTKRVDSISEAIQAINVGCKEAVSGRKGPVLLDFSSKVLKSDIEVISNEFHEDNEKKDALIDACIADIYKNLKIAKRPIILIGDGVRLSQSAKAISKVSIRHHIPILSSRCSQDIVCRCENYFGYIGSHGLRYSNFILSKTDCIISFGNRLAFPITSKSFKPVIENAKIIQMDIDASELERNIPNATGYCVELNPVLTKMSEEESICHTKEWLEICKLLKKELINYDINPGVIALSKVIEQLKENDIIVCDIGNNELLSSRAYAISASGKRMLHSKAFKTVGSAIGKAIGAYYATCKRVMCIVGDQGFQFNIQELQYIRSNCLPIIFIICNNDASEMLKDSEYRQGYHYSLHTTIDSGYSHPSFEKIAIAYGIEYTAIRELRQFSIELLEDKPQIIELFFDESCIIQQSLPKGYPCQMFVPEISRETYDYLNGL